MDLELACCVPTTRSQPAQAQELGQAWAVAVSDQGLRDSVPLTVDAGINVRGPFVRDVP